MLKRRRAFKSADLMTSVWFLSSLEPGSTFSSLSRLYSLLVTVLGLRSDFEFTLIPNWAYAFQINLAILTGRWIYSSVLVLNISLRRVYWSSRISLNSFSRTDFCRCCSCLISWRTISLRASERFWSVSCDFPGSGNLHLYRTSLSLAFSKSMDMSSIDSPAIPSSP